MAGKKENEENSYSGKNPGNESRPVKRSRKFLGFLFIIGLLLIAAFALVFWKFNFIIKDELVLVIEPSSISMDSTNRDVNHVFFKVAAQRFIGCEAECQCRFRDFSRNITISDEKIALAADSFEREYVVTLNKSGEGQAIYLFEVECSNRKSFFCSTEGAKREKSAVVSINYHLTSEEAGIKQMIYSEKDALDSNISSSISRIGRIRGEYSLIAKNYLSNLSEEMLSLSAILDSSGIIEKGIESDKLAIENAWRQEDYSSSRKIFSEGLRNSAGLLSASADSGENILNSALSLYNSLYERMGMLISGQKSILPEIYNYSKLSGDSQLLRESSAVSSSISEIASLLKWRSYKSIKNLSIYAESVSSNLSLLENSYNKKVESSFVKSSSELYAAELYAREIDSEIPSLALKISEIALKNSSYPELENSCAGMLHLSNAVNSRNADALLALSSSSFENSSEFREASDAILKNAFSISASSVLLEIQNAAQSASYSRISLINSSLYHLRENISEIQPINLSGALENMSVSELKSLSLIEVPESFNRAFSEHCGVLDKSRIDSELSTFSVSIPRIEVNQPSSPVNFSLVLSENRPECCAFGKCSICCNGNSCPEEKGYPVILLHGHLAYNRNSPELVINSFSDMQSSMESIGYIPAGLLDLNANVPQNDWGMGASPVAVRASYYYISYYNLGFQTVESQKSESIENYAIRLREIVEEVKRRTGSGKVIIIAHSMGGLVAREYLLLFGEESVDKMITIGTPNKGIEGALVELCPIFGSEKECSDMAKDSIFLKRLNDERNNPKSVRMYTIAATGCDTYGKEGDGVVAADNVALDFAVNYRISGNCTDILKSNLHGRMLIPDEYPETFDILSSILRE